MLNGNSFAVIGGRSCGKTSQLMEIEADLNSMDISPYSALPIYIDMRQFANIDLEVLFKTIYSLVVEKVYNDYVLSAITSWSGFSTRTSWSG